MGYFEDKEEEVSWGWSAPVKDTQTTDPVVLDKFVNEFSNEDYKIFDEDIIQPGVLWNELEAQGIDGRIVSITLDHDIVLKNHQLTKETVIRLYGDVESVYKYGITGFPEDAADWEWVVDYEPNYRKKEMDRWVEPTSIMKTSDGVITVEWDMYVYPRFFDMIYSRKSHLKRRIKSIVKISDILKPDEKMYRLDQYYDWYMSVLRDINPTMVEVSTQMSGHDLKYIVQTPEDTIIEEYHLLDTLAKLLGIKYIPVKPLVLSLKNKIADGKIVVPDTHRRISRRMR